ncbi:Phage integrase [Pseudomonas syringae pv. cilantro]|uniref:Phage integrase n=2 Tax=Pseudomonas syringae group TaxID=136849 RepID=A0A0N0XDG1_PSESX|nr:MULTISPECIES: integrase arm-type DNA-binding domain-containing protein [Pseudomonas syringae group]KPC33547.1 Phage integrase [Pseudomonas syringae pv. cilantro]KPW71001.1 putative phiRv1 integrase [Pseudomonas syringae pv. coriandricola]RMN07498.1 Phage integrase [Pseudomonas syringae pv. coriandricola]
MPPDNAVVFKRKLSDALIRSLTEPGKHADGEVPGLYLEVRASSKVGKSPSKVWRLKYRLRGKENRFSIGAYPDISLKEARDIARGARRDVANHTAPLKAKNAKIEAHLLNEVRTFEYVAKQWLAFKSAELVTKSISGFTGALNNHILPAIGKKPISDIKLEHITTTITKLRRQRTIAMARLLELSLSHRMPSALGAVYARARLQAQRREAAQKRVDYLDHLRQNAARATTDY